MDIRLVPLAQEDKEAFIRDLQVSFKKAVVETFGDDGKEVITRENITDCFAMEGAESYHIVADGVVVGGTVVAIHSDTKRSELLLFFVKVDRHSRGLGLAAWQAIEARYPQTEVWETHTPYFEKRNIHFYVNKCGFHIVEFFNKYHPESNVDYSDPIPGGDGFFRFEKRRQFDKNSAASAEAVSSLCFEEKRHFVFSFTA